jgi:uncharacterized protein YjgD (DUF1641 family)
MPPLEASETKAAMEAMADLKTRAAALGIGWLDLLKLLKDPRMLAFLQMLKEIFLGQAPGPLPGPPQA